MTFERLDFLLRFFHLLQMNGTTFQRPARVQTRVTICQTSLHDIDNCEREQDCTVHRWSTVPRCMTINNRSLLSLTLSIIRTVVHSHSLRRALYHIISNDFMYFTILIWCFFLWSSKLEYFFLFKTKLLINKLYPNLTSISGGYFLPKGVWADWKIAVWLSNLLAS